MLASFYTLRALAQRWNRDLVGGRLVDAYSQNRNELTVVVLPDATEERGGAATDDAGAWTLHFLVGAERAVFRSDGYHRARRNSVTLFEGALDRRVTAVRVAERDRFLYLDLDDGSVLAVLLFGPRPNVLWMDDEHIREAFLRDTALRETKAPQPRPAPRVDTLAAFEARWTTDRNTVRAALARTLPLFGHLLAAEATVCAGLDPEGDPAALGEGERQMLFEAAQALEAEVVADTLAPHIYERDGEVEAFALVPLRHLADTHEAVPFEDLDLAVRRYARRRLGQRRFRARYEPVAKALAAAHERRARSAEAMLDELATPSRADRYEAYGHLLMAQATALSPGQDAVTLPNILEDGQPVTIPLDPAKSGIENAERFYDKARRTRQARVHAEDRWQKVQAEADEAAALLAQVDDLERVADIERFLKTHADALARFTGREAVGEERLPYRRFPLPGGYEAWVGKNARSNAELTTRHARPFDLWLHARGVPGSHVVVRVRGRGDRPNPRAVETAAALAAFYSEARGGSLVPVIVTERKYVRPIKGGAPGLVRVDREEVVLVEPKRVDSAAS